MIRDDKASLLSRFYLISKSRFPRLGEGKRHGGKTRDERATPSPAHGLDPKRVERMTEASRRFPQTSVIYVSSP